MIVTAIEKQVNKKLFTARGPEPKSGTAVKSFSYPGRLVYRACNRDKTANWFERGGTARTDVQQTTAVVNILSIRFLNVNLNKTLHSSVHLLPMQGLP